MRRVAIGLLAAAALVVTLAAARGGSDGGSSRVDAIFSNASGLIPGQNVEIAGAVVGEVSGIELTPRHHARVEMNLQTGFAPFRSDATCEIKPQSLIGEKFVECDPGSPDAKELGTVDGAPTVPLQHTHAPVAPSRLRVGPRLGLVLACPHPRQALRRLALEGGIARGVGRR